MAPYSSWLPTLVCLLLAVGLQAAPVSQPEPPKDQVKTEHVQGTSVEGELQALTGQETPEKPVKVSHPNAGQIQPQEQQAPAPVPAQAVAAPAVPAKPQPVAQAGAQPDSHNEAAPAMGDSKQKRGGPASPALPPAVSVEKEEEEEEEPVSEEDALALPIEALQLPQEELFDPEVDLSPRAVAEYLLVTGDFQGFENAVIDILQSQIMSPDQAQQYRDAVGLEYESLLGQMTQNAYLQDLVESEPASVVEYREPPRTRAAGIADLVSDNLLDMPEVDLGMALKQMQLKAMLEREDNLDQLLETMVEEYLTQQRDEDEGLKVDEEELAQLIDLMGQEEAEEDQNLPTDQGQYTETDMSPEQQPEEAEEQEEPQEEEQEEKNEEPDVVEQLLETSGAQKTEEESPDRTKESQA